MGLTASSTGRGLRKTDKSRSDGDFTVALVGNPNVGKSTVFNCLTGLKQHTGNWPGKTVSLATGRFFCGKEGFTLVDLPGTYSLAAKSPEEEVTRDYLESGQADCVVVVCDATCLRRNLALVLQVCQLTDRVVLCLNLMDEARQRGICIDTVLLEQELGIPVIPAAAGRGRGMEELKSCLWEMCRGKREVNPEFSLPNAAVFAGSDEDMTDFMAGIFVREGEKIAARCLKTQEEGNTFRKRLDAFLTGKVTGTATMLLLLLAVFWLTIQGANYPSDLLQCLFDWGQERLTAVLGWFSVPPWLISLLMDGAYATTARVVAVMLPPMAIFFPLFTLLEDLGYLPRVAFLMDHRFQKCGSCGKQALTMCMGFGCNAAGVVGCRIIDSPRERKIAILTNSLVPCNGRFPMLIALISVFFAAGGVLGSLTSALILTLLILLSVGMTFLVSGILSKTVLRGEPSSFAMELPPFRRPKVLQVLYRSFIDRTAFVLGRAVAVAAPAGLIIWCAVNLQVEGKALLLWLSGFLEPLGAHLGVNGMVMAAFLLGFPANELVLPILLLAIGGQGELGQVLLGAGWTWQTGLCTLILCLFHWPCSTTCLTIYKETKSFPITILSVILPTLVGFFLCLLCRAIFLL